MLKKRWMRHIRLVMITYKSGQQGKWSQIALPMEPVEQRMTWFGTGFKSGQVESCDTFNQAI